MTWEVFAPTNRKGGVYVSLYPSGAASISHDAYVAIGSPPRVELLYDRARCMAGIRPAADGTHTVNNKSSRVVSFGALLSMLHLDRRKVARRYPAKVKDGMLVFGPITEADGGKP